MTRVEKRRHDSGPPLQSSPFGCGGVGAGFKHPFCVRFGWNLSADEKTRRVFVILFYRSVRRSERWKRQFLLSGKKRKVVANSMAGKYSGPLRLKSLFDSE